MLHRRPRLLRVLGSALVASAVLGGCSMSGQGDPVADAAREARALGDSLIEATTFAHSAPIDQQSAQASLDAIQMAEDSIAQLASIGFDITQPTTFAIVTDLRTSAERVVAELRIGTAAGADAIRVAEFVPLERQLASLGGIASDSGDLRAQEGTDTTGLNAGMFALISLGVLSIALAVVAFRTFSPRPGHRASDPAPPASGPQRLWGQSPPAMAPTPEATEQDPDDSDAGTATKPRPARVPLQRLLNSATRQLEGRGWQVTMICPDVQIWVDPRHLQRVVIAAIESAFLRGAQHAGVAVEVSEERLEIVIGDDAPSGDQATSEDLESMVERARGALDHAQMNVELVREEGVTLFILSIDQARRPIEVAR